MFLLQYSYLYFIDKPQNIVDCRELEMIQGSNIHLPGNQLGPTFGYLFVRGALVEEEFGNCVLKFVYEKHYQEDTW